MYRTIPMMMLVFASQGAAAEWIDVGHNGDFTLYTDPATLRRSGTRVRMVSLIDHKAALEVTGKTYLSVKAEHEYDCQNGRARMLFTSMHSGHMGKGKIVSSNYSADNFEPVLRRSIVATLWQSACRQP